MTSPRVVIIGAGPAGLAAALRLHDLGMTDVVVLERERQAGGIPRHCGHWGFGWESHRRLWRGPAYAEMLRKAAQHVTIRTQTSVLGLTPRGRLRVHDAQGVSELAPGRILLATGTRESSRAARLTGGVRSDSIMNTGTLQQLVYLKAQKPFERPVIIGTEWVSFSALLTCRHAGIRPAAMVSEHGLEAPLPFAWGARLGFGVPVHRHSKLVAIHGRRTVEAVEIETMRGRKMIGCDGVILTGRFRPDSALYAGLLEREGEAPRVDEAFRTSLPAIYAAGNILEPLKTAGKTFLQGRAAADSLVKDLP